MPITSDCGYHCGIRANAENTISREAHCSCGEPCHQFQVRQGAEIPPGGVISRNGAASAPAQPRDLDGAPLRGTPMCARWYEQAGGYRPWQPHEPDLAAQRDELIRRLAP